MEITGAEMIIKALKSEGVDVVFGYPGGSVIPFFDSLMESGIRHVLPRHEQGGTHMADGYARATGKVGVMIATSGPGATNVVTGVATANFDSIPLVVLTGQVNTSLLGNDAFQEADTTGICRPITKHTYLVKDPNELAVTLKEAFHIARSGRPGPVVVDIPVNVTKAAVADDLPDTVDIPSYKPTYDGNPRQIQRCAEELNRAERPVLYVGGGCILSGAAFELAELVKRSGAPVTWTLMGCGAFPGRDRHSLGMLGMHGTVYANYTIMDADFILAIGARFDDRVTGRIDHFAPHAKLAHIDIDPTSIKKNVRVDIPIVGDVRRVLAELNRHVERRERAAWWEKIDGWRTQYPLKYERKEGVSPQYVIEEVCKRTSDDTIVTTEVGQHQMWVAQYYDFRRPRTLLTSGGLGTMGYGLPAAIGAKIGCPDKQVICFAGDGSIQMNIQELATIKTEKLPVKIIVLNNGYLGMVRQWQELFFGRRYAATPLAAGNPDFVKLADAYGIRARRITGNAEVTEAVDELLAAEDAALLEVMIEPEENVFPMVPAGEAINRMIGGMA